MTTERDLRVGTATRGPDGSLPATSEFGRRVISAKLDGSPAMVGDKTLAEWASSDEPLIDDEGNELPVGRRTSHVLRSADQEILDAPDLLESEQTPNLSSSWDQLRNSTSRKRDAKNDFASVVSFRQEVIDAENEAPRPWIDPRKEIAYALWGATVDSSSETFIMAKDLSRAVLPFDKLIAGIAYSANGESFWEGAAEAEADNNRVNEDIRAGADAIAPANETLYGGITRGMATFMIPYMGISKAAGGLKFLDATAAGFVLDATLFNPKEGNLSNLIQELNPDTQSVVLDFLATDPNDSDALNRLRNGLEGGILGTALEGIFRAARWSLRQADLKRAKDSADKLDYDVDLSPENTADDIKVEAELEVSAGDTEVLIHQANTPEDAAAILADGFDADRIGQSGVADFTDGFWFNVDKASSSVEDGVTVALRADAKIVTFNSADEFFAHLSDKLGVTVNDDNYIQIIRDQGRKVADDGIDAYKFGPDFELQGTPYDPGMVVVRNNDVIEIKGKANGVDAKVDKQSPDVDAKVDEDAKLIDEIDLATDLRSTLQLSDEQAAAYVKALDSGDVQAADAVMNDFNANTIDWKNIESAEDVATVIRVTSEIFAEHIDKVKGGVIGHTRTIRAANLVGTTGEKVHTLYNDLTGDQGITARMHAAERTMITSAKHLYQLRESVRAAPNNVEAKSDFYRHMQLHAALQAEVKGAKTEIARALNGMAILKADADEGFREFDDVLRQLSGKSSDPKAFGRFMDNLLDGRSLSDLNAKIAQSTGQRFKNVIIEFVINSMLSSLKTHAINLTSNVLNTFLYTADRFIGGSYRYLRGDKRLLREARLDLFGKFNQLDEAWRLAKQAWVDGAPVTDKRQRLEFMTRKAISMDGEGWLANTVNTLGTVVRVPGRALITGDEFFKAINRNAEIDVLAFRKADEEAAEKGLKYGTKEYETFITDRSIALADPNNVTASAREIRSSAVEKSRMATFQESAKTVTGQAVERAVNSNAFVKLIIAPFFRTPMNILRQGVIDRTPLGLIIGEARDQVLRGTANQRAEVVARMTTGVAAMAAGYTFISNGGQDKGYEIVGRRAYDSSGKVDGVQDYSIRVGDTWYQFNRLDPLGMWLGMMADMEHSARHFDATDPDAEGRTFALAQGAMAGFYNNVANKTWMKSMADLLELGEKLAEGKPVTSQRAMAQFAAQKVGMFVPAIIKSTGAALEGERTARNTWTFYDALTAQIPFLSADLPPRHDILGRPMTREMSALSVINPFATSPDSDDPVDREFARLAFDVKPMPRSLGNGAMQLSDKEYSELTGMVADNGLEERLRDLITADSWEGKTPERRVYEIKKHLEIARTAARLQFIAKPAMRERFRNENFQDLRSLISPTTP